MVVLLRILPVLGMEEVSRTLGLGVKSVNPQRDDLWRRQLTGTSPTVSRRKLGYRRGLETRLVLAVNDDCFVLQTIRSFAVL